MTSTTHSPRVAHRATARQRGQSAIEYLVLLAVFVLAVFVPVDGDDPAIVVLADAVRSAFATFSAAVSLP
jgi:hypothetical protein